uniref:mitogen-activated protein kinase kinase n=1 Tax=Macrostomum lignano TaxID=282301 RepID=A0A1I8FR28_9PLAT
MYVAVVKHCPIEVHNKRALDSALEDANLALLQLVLLLIKGQPDSLPSKQAARVAVNHAVDNAESSATELVQTVKVGGSSRHCDAIDAKCGNIGQTLRLANSPNQPAVLGGVKLALPLNFAEAIEAATRAAKLTDTISQVWPMLPHFSVDGVTMTARATDFDSLDELGSGRFGVVDRRIRLSFDQQEHELQQREISVLKRTVECPFVVYFYGAMFHDGDIHILMELMDASLRQFYLAAYSFGCIAKVKRWLPTVRCPGESFYLHGNGESLVPAGDEPGFTTASDVLVQHLTEDPPPSLSAEAAAGRFPQELNDFLSCCLARRRKDRWRLPQLLEHPYVGGVVAMETELRDRTGQFVCSVLDRCDSSSLAAVGVTVKE